MPIRLVAGLGNPGREYAKTRHNAGWLVVDAFARKHGLGWRTEPKFEAEVARWEPEPGNPVWFCKPLTHMNDSGRSVAALARFYRITPDEIAAVLDDLNIEVGKMKVSVSGSDGGHNGLASLLERLGEGFVRLRIGIGPRQPPEMDLKDFVLSEFFPEQLAIITAKTENFVSGLELVLERGPEQAMNQINRKDQI